MIDLIGLGIGPFNLSLAAQLAKAPATSRFFERKENFDWHSEILFPDSTMQTCYLKDLVTPVDPTSRFTFLNYLVEHRLFYPFMNTGRTVISRREFEQYASWVSRQMPERLQFGTDVEAVSFRKDHFEVETSKGQFRSRNLCIATGHVPRVPKCVESFLGNDLFHAKSKQLREMDLEGKSLLIVGGGQTGIEIFRNALHGRWGGAREVRLATARRNLEPLDESAFVNEYFSPGWIDTFWNLSAERKAEIVASQKLASDGNTPSYLKELYNDLYRFSFVENRRNFKIMASRGLIDCHARDGGYELTFENSFSGLNETLSADVVVLATGFQSRLPRAIEPLLPLLHLDDEGRLKFRKNYSVEWSGPLANRIYALNFSRHGHGIADPQTSLMAQRSAVVVNDLCGRRIYETSHFPPNFVDHGGVMEPR